MTNIYCFTEVDASAFKGLQGVETPNIKHLKIDPETFKAFRKSYHFCAMNASLDLPIGDYIAYSLYLYKGKRLEESKTTIDYMLKHKLRKLPFNMASTLIKRVPEGITFASSTIAGEIDLKLYMLKNNSQNINFENIYYPLQPKLAVFNKSLSMSELRDTLGNDEDFKKQYNTLYKACLAINSDNNVIPLDKVEEFCDYNYKDIYEIS